MDNDALFTEHRPLLCTVAYEILGVATDAEDIGHDSYLRFGKGRAQLTGPRDWRRHEVVMVRVEEEFPVSSAEFLELVLNIERYADVDKKIRPVLWAERDGDTVRFACRPKLVGLRQPKVIQVARRTGERVEIGLTPRPENRIAHAIAEFEASFECAPTPGGGTRVVRHLEFHFAPWLRWLLEPLFQRRLEPEVREELRAAKASLRG